VQLEQAPDGVTDSIGLSPEPEVEADLNQAMFANQNKIWILIIH
jgi:hypothetical protein